MKTCTKCGKQLTATPENFHRNPSSKDGLCSSCKTCRIEATRTWEKNNKQHRRNWCNTNRHRNLLRDQYRMTVGEYEVLLASQGGVCAICMCPPKGKRKKLFVDHDHITGRNRGLLCLTCNAALERMESIPDWHGKALSYLVKFEVAKREKEFK